MKNFSTALIIKTVLTIWFLIILFIGSIGCPRSAEEKTAVKRKHYQKVTSNIINGIHYIKDTRINPPACFAHYWGGNNYYGGPALATVPCENIPPEMFFTTGSFQE